MNITKCNGELGCETMRIRLKAPLARSLLGIETHSSLRFRFRVLIQEMPTELDMDDLTPQRLEEVIREVTRDMRTNTDLDMREFLGIDKALARIKGKLENNAGKLTEIDEHLEREKKKLKYIEDSPDLREHEQRVKEIIADLREERSARLEIISQELASQFSSIRQTVEKILDEDLNLKTQAHHQGPWLDDHRSADIAGTRHLDPQNLIDRWRCCRWLFNVSKESEQRRRMGKKQAQGLTLTSR